MSDEQQPPRKVGSLRDRIAQFDKPTAGPPVTAPKPAVSQKKWAWKEKQAEVQAHPPPPPAASASSSTLAAPAAPERDSWSDVSSHHDVPEKAAPAPAPAFSAADAASSIAAGGGLKARLAALQGSGFGSTPDAPAIPPPPAGKPRVWKKVVVPYEAPPKPERPHPAEDETAEAEEEHHHDEPEAHPVAEEGEADADATDEPKDPEEEERKRRAAIAARMARLGGARVGMGMPVFGMKPPVPAPIRKDSGTDTETAAAAAPARQASASPPVPRKEPSIEEPSESVRDSVAETEMTYEEETTTEATESKEDIVHHEILPTPASPPRPRPPVPATRAWSNSPPASPKMRPEVISQEDGAAVEEVEGGGDRKGRGEGRQEEDSGEGHQKGLTEGKEGDEKEGELEPKKPSHDAPVPTALSLALQIDKHEPGLEASTSPPSIPTSARPTSASPASASSGKPLPPMPKRALPPRRKMPTPKVSSEAVPSVTSPPVPEASLHPDDEKPAAEAELKPEGVDKTAAEEKAATPPAEAVAEASQAEAVPEHAETTHEKEDSTKGVEKEVPSSPRGGSRVSEEALEAAGNEEKKVDDEKSVENVKPIEKATGGEVSA